MNCDEIRNLLGPLHDQELPGHEAKAVTDHLHGCLQCQVEFREIAALSETLAQVPRYAASPELAIRINDQLEAAAASQENNSFSARSWSKWLRPAISHATAAVIGGVIIFGALRSGDETGSAQREVIAAHVRSLMSPNLARVEAGDPHKVKPWFSGKLDYAPKFKNLAAQKFPLTGGRIDYLRDRTIAVLTYRRREHRINLFVIPADGKSDAMPRASNRNGFNAVHWTSNSFIYWAVSDLNEPELLEFARLAAQ